MVGYPSDSLASYIYTLTQKQTLRFSSITILPIYTVNEQTTN